MLGEVQLSNRNVISFSQVGSMQFFPLLPLNVLAFHLLNQWKHENTCRAIRKGIIQQGHWVAEMLAGMCMLALCLWVWPCDFKLITWSDFSWTNLYRSVDRLKYWLILGRRKEMKVFCIVTIAKETTLLVSMVGVSFFPLCGCWRTVWL